MGHLRGRVTGRSRTVGADRSAIDLLRGRLTSTGRRLGVLTHRGAERIVHGPRGRDIVRRACRRLVGRYRDGIVKLRGRVVLAGGGHDAIIRIAHVTEATVSIFGSLIGGPGLSGGSLRLVIRQVCVCRSDVRVGLGSSVRYVLRDKGLPRNRIMGFGPNVVSVLSERLIRTMGGHPSGICSIGMVDGNSPLRVFASTNKRIVFGGCSPVNRLSNFTIRYTRTLTSTAGLNIVIYSHSRYVTTTNISGGRILREHIAPILRNIVRSHGAGIFRDRGRLTLRNIGHHLYLTYPVVVSNSIDNTITVMTDSDVRGSSRTSRGLTRITTKFLDGRLRSWGATTGCRDRGDEYASTIFYCLLGFAGPLPSGILGGYRDLKWGNSSFSPGYSFAGPPVSWVLRFPSVWNRVGLPVSSE